MIIYFDMDSVLCDFDGMYEQVTGSGFGDNIRIADRSARLHSLTQEEKEAKWTALQPFPNFFLELPWVEGSKEMLQRVRARVGDKNIGILSAASSHIPQSVEQKHQWLDREIAWIPIENRLVVKRKRDKALHAKGNMLVDDLDTNITEWVSAGGIGIQFFTAAQAERDVFQALNLL